MSHKNPIMCWPSKYHRFMQCSIFRFMRHTVTSTIVIPMKSFAVIYLSVYFGLVGLQHAAFLFSSSPRWHQPPISSAFVGLRNKWGRQQTTTAKGRRNALRPVAKPQMTMIRSSIFSSSSAAASAKNFQRNTNKSFAFYNCSIPVRLYTVPQVPQFIIIGAQKSGTTALFEFLKEHPYIQLLEFLS